MSTTAQDRERRQIAENTRRRVTFGKTTRRPDPQSWNGVDK